MTYGSYMYLTCSNVIIVTITSHLSQCHFILINTINDNHLDPQQNDACDDIVVLLRLCGPTKEN